MFGELSKNWDRMFCCSGQLTKTNNVILISEFSYRLPKHQSWPLPFLNPSSWRLCLLLRLNQPTAKFIRSVNLTHTRTCTKTSMLYHRMGSLLPHLSTRRLLPPLIIRRRLLIIRRRLLIIRRRLQIIRRRLQIILRPLPPILPSQCTSRLTRPFWLPLQSRSWLLLQLPFKLWG